MHLCLVARHAEVASIPIPLINAILPFLLLCLLVSFFIKAYKERFSCGYPNDVLCCHIALFSPLVTVVPVSILG